MVPGLVITPVPSMSGAKEPKITAMRLTASGVTPVTRPTTTTVARPVTMCVGAVIRLISTHRQANAHGDRMLPVYYLPEGT